MKTEQKLNMTMLCDFYELTMGNGYLKAGYQDRITYFDVFFRNVPDQGGFAICAGLDQLIDYIENLHFDEEDIQYLREKQMFSEEFLEYLRNFHFSGDIWAIPEGTPIFPREPVVTVRDIYPSDHQPPEPDRHQGQPDRPGGQGTDRAGIWFPPGTGHGRRHHRRPGRVYRRLQGYGMCHLRPALRRPRRRYHGPLLGADV